MPNVIIRVLAAIGFAYLVLTVVDHFVPNLAKGAAITIALLSGVIISLAVRDRKPAERDNV